MQMLRNAALAMVVIAAACAPAQDAREETAVTPPPAETSRPSVPAPTPSEVTIRIRAEQAGQTIEVPVTARFAVELVGVPTAGYAWTPTRMPAFITRAGEATGNTVREQSQPGYAGGNHWEVLMFAAMEPGTGELVLEQRRPWESNEAPAQVFRVTIVAR